MHLHSVNSISVVIHFLSGAKTSVIAAIIISILVVSAVAVTIGIFYWFHCKYIVDNVKNAPQYGLRIVNKWLEVGSTGVTFIIG